MTLSNESRRLRAKRLRERIDYFNGDGERPDLREYLAHHPELEAFLQEWRRPLLRLLARSAEEGGRAKDVFWALDAGLDRLQGEETLHSSSPEELAQYRRQLLNRVEWLEAALESLLGELERLDESVEAKPPLKTEAPFHSPS